ncbi:hypothetical protein JCM10212_003706 [Sporobolomyces blumeae]
MSPQAAPSLPPTPYASGSTSHHRRTRGEWDSPHRDGSSSTRNLSLTRQTPSTRGTATAAHGQQLVRPGDVKPSYSRQRQEILTEEEYVTHLSEIIKRDFFPHLRTLDAQHSVLDAFESEDPDRIEHSVREMRELCTPNPRRKAREGATPGRTPFDAASTAATPTYFDRTPLTVSSTPGYATSSRRSARMAPPLPSIPPRIDPSLSLDAFQSRYTSEDNSSFAELLARDNAARRAKHQWAWDAEKKANEKVVRGREARERLVDVTRDMVESSTDGTVWLLDGGAGRPGERKLLVGRDTKVGEGDRLMIKGRDERERLMITGGQTDQKLIMGPPGLSIKGQAKGKGKEVVDDKAKQYVDYDRPAVDEEEEARPVPTQELQVDVQGSTFKNRNSLMFAPDADVDPGVPTASTSTSQPASSVDPSQPVLPLGEPKGIRYHATRLMELEKGPNGSEAGTPSPSRSRIGAAIAGTPYPSSSTSTSQTPRVSGFSFVDALPSPRASALPPSALQELMTWGTIEATPVTLRTSEDFSVGPFRLEDTSRRETLAFKMANKAKRSLAESASTGKGKGLAVDARRGGAGGAGHDSLRKSVLDSTRGGGGGGGRTPSTRGPGSPRTSAGNLSPAARSLLGKTKPGRALETSLSRTRQWTEDEERRRVERAKTRAREVESQDRLRRERWTPSPAVSLGFDPDLEG